MSSDFLSAAERERWQRFPETIPQDDLVVYFLLSDDDEREVNRQREPFNRLGYALQLYTLRYLGFVPTDFTATPEVAVTFVAEQLGIPHGFLPCTTIGGPKAIIAGTCGPMWGFVRPRPWMCMPCKPGCWHALSNTINRHCCSNWPAKSCTESALCDRV